MKFFKKQLLALTLLLGGAQFAQAITLDEITPETIVKITGNEIGDFLKSLNSTDQITAARQIATSITKETIGKVKFWVIKYLLNADMSLLKQFSALIDKETIAVVDPEIIRDMLNSDRSLAKQFTTLIDINKETIVKYHRWISDIIDHLVRDDKRLLNTFAQLIDKETIITAQYTAYTIIYWCMNNDPTMANHFANLIDKKTIINTYPSIISSLIQADKNLIKYFTNLIDKETVLKIEPDILMHLLEKDPNWVVRELLQADKSWAKHLAVLIDKETIVKVGPEVIRELLYADKSLVKQFAALIDKETIVKVDTGVIYYLLNADMSLAKQFAELIDKESIVKVDTGVIYYLLNADKGLVKQFAALINKETIAKVDSGVIKYILDADKGLAKKFSALIDKETITKINPKTIKHLLKVDPTLQKQFAELIVFTSLKDHTSIESQLFASEKITSIKSLAIELNISSNIPFKNSKLQSVQHFDTVAHKFSTDIFENLKNLGLNESDRAMLLRFIHQSRLEEKKGNCTFVHAQVRSFLPLSDIFKRVVELCENNGNSYGDAYYPLRFTKSGGAFALKDQNIADIKKHGLYKDSSTKNFDDHGVFTLCMNGYLFGSADIGGSYSLKYWLENYDQSSNKGLTLTMRKMLEVYGLEQYYDHYQKEFELLWDDVTKGGQRGNLVLLSLTPEQVKKWVYPSHGERKKNYFTIDGEKTDDVAFVLETLKTDPKKMSVNDLKNLHYCLVLSDQALDPVNGVKIYPFTSDESYVRAWREKLDALFVKIKQDIAQNKKLEQQKLQPQVTQVIQNKTSSNECMPTSTPINNPTVNRRLAVLTGQLQTMNSK